MKTTSKLFCAKGNVAGFAANGSPVIGQRRRDGSWQIWTNEFNPMLDAKTFATGKDADEYAASIICPTMTEMKKWW